MASYKPPDFKERAALAAQAKRAAVDRHLAKEKEQRGTSTKVGGRAGKALQKKKKQEEHRKAQEAEKDLREQWAAERVELERLLAEPSEIEKSLARSARYTPRKRK